MLRKFGTDTQHNKTRRRDEENKCDTPVCECHELEDAMFIEKAPKYVRRLLEDNEKQKEALQQIEKWLAGTLANEDLTIVESKVLEIARKALKG